MRVASANDQTVALSRVEGSRDKASRYEIAAQLWAGARGEVSTALPQILAGLAWEISDICERGDSMKTPIPEGLEDLSGKLLCRAIRIGRGSEPVTEEEAPSVLLAPFRNYLVNFGELLLDEQRKLRKALALAEVRQKEILPNPTKKGFLELIQGPREKRDGNLIDLQLARDKRDALAELGLDMEFHGMNLGEMCALAIPSVEVRVYSESLMTLRITIERQQRALLGLAEVESAEAHLRAKVIEAF